MTKKGKGWIIPIISILWQAWKHRREIRRSLNRFKKFFKHLNDISDSWGVRWTQKEASLLDHIYYQIEDWAAFEPITPHSEQKKQKFIHELRQTRTGKALLSMGDGVLGFVVEDVCRAQRRTGKAKGR